MGYNTYYSIEVFTIKDGMVRKQNNSDIMRLIASEAKKVFCNDYGIDDLFGRNSGTSCTWYDYAKDMNALAILPSMKMCVFVVTGCGEDYGDIWRHIFYRDKNIRQKAEIRFDGGGSEEIANSIVTD